MPIVTGSSGGSYQWSPKTAATSKAGGTGGGGTKTGSSVSPFASGAPGNLLQENELTLSTGVWLDEWDPILMAVLAGEV